MNIGYKMSYTNDIDVRDSFKIATGTDYEDLKRKDIQNWKRIFDEIKEMCKKEVR